MASKTATVQTPGGRQIISQSEKPAHLATKAGPGRTRQPTDFDDLVPQWYETGEWYKIPAEGETTEDQLADLEEVYKSVQRAVAYHELGVSRLKEDNPEDEKFSGYGVWVQVRDRQKRPRKPKDENGNVIEQDEFGYEDGDDSDNDE